jgi:hypothetical protein
MKGYKGFEKGLVCRGKQYAENTIFEEDKAEICKSGMHFCENPFDVLEYYGFVNNKGIPNEFAEVEALDEVKTDDNKKFTTKKLKVGAKIGISGLIKAFVEFTLSKVDFENAAATNTGDYSAATNTGNRSAATNTGCQSAATNTGDHSAATNTGYQSAATNTGYQSAAIVEGKESFAIATGVEGKAKGKKGCYIAVAEWVWSEKEERYVLKAFKTAKVDGKKIKEDVFYGLKDGKFVEV